MKPSVETALAVAATHAAAALAQTADACPVANRVCFRWAVPQQGARGGLGAGSVYFQLRAPASYEWVGLGIGSQMADSAMFVMYADGRGNVTLSTRLGTGYTMPQYLIRSDVELLAGSSAANGVMVANVRCRQGCGGLNLAGATGWFAAWKEGAPLDSASVEAPISYHDAHSNFDVNLAEAAVGPGTDPFLSPGGGSGGVVIIDQPMPSRTLAWAHGVLMTLAFVIGYPIGSIIMPLVGKWMVHAGWQMLVFVAMLVAFAMGVAMSTRAGYFFKGPHTQLGVLVVALMALQPVLGSLHHRHFVRHGRRGAISYAHIWYGRSLIVLGIINGGLGLRLSGSRQQFVTAYIVLASIFTALYLAVIAFGFARDRNRGREPLESPRAADVPMGRMKNSPY